MKFLYHNHYHEFQKLQDKYVLYHIMENTDPQYVDFELDTFWAHAAGRTQWRSSAIWAAG